MRVLALWVLAAVTAVVADEAALLAIFSQMDSDVLALRDRLETAYQSHRCSYSSRSLCSAQNYEVCYSELPDTECSGLSPEMCGSTAGSFWSKNVTTISIPESVVEEVTSSGLPVSGIIDATCFSREVNDYMVDQYKVQENFWKSYGSEPSFVYYGAWNGVFRQQPAITLEKCGAYDPRERPWYVAASSGPKDVIVIIDISGSMRKESRLDNAKVAAETVVETLTVGDRVAVITFNGGATNLVGSTEMVRATTEEKNKLIVKIRALEATGDTNYYNAFNLAFQSLSEAIASETTTGCNAAILFLTDGEDRSNQDVITQVKDEVNNFKTQTGNTREIYIFTYSLGDGVENSPIKSDPKGIACETGGLWAHIDDASGSFFYDGNNVKKAMASYYKLFAIGLGESVNEDFTAVVEPYLFSSSGGGTDDAQYGTTVSAPIFDRSVTPPLFLGVAGVDADMKALTEAFGGDDPSGSKILQEFIKRSTAKCPALQLSECDLEALRLLSNSDDSRCKNYRNYMGCNDNTDSLPVVEPRQCGSFTGSPRSGMPESMDDLWINRDNQGESDEQRVCRAQCGGADDPGFILVISSVGGAIAVIICVLVCAGCIKHSQKKKKQVEAPSANTYPQPSAPPEAPDYHSNVTMTNTNHDKQRFGPAPDLAPPPYNDDWN